MVTTNPVNLARMDDERRKKATMEKAKAAHLSKQLQLRLQYARLKVDYGWQRQNLNEVENLYFHHSSQKGRLKPPLPRPHAKPAPGPPPISYPSPVHSTPHIVDVNMFQHQKEEPQPQPQPPTPLLPSAPTHGSSFTSSHSSTAETYAMPANQASGSGSGAEASDGMMGPPLDVPPAEPSVSSTPAPDQVMLSPFAPPPHPPPDAAFAALSPSPFAPPPSPFVPSLYAHAAAPPNSGPPPPNPGQPAQATQPAYGLPPPAAHTIPSAQALPAAYKTFDVATAAMPGAGGGGAHAPLTYDSFWSSHSSVGGWRRHMGPGGAAATG